MSGERNINESNVKRNEGDTGEAVECRKINDNSCRGLAPVPSVMKGVFRASVKKVEIVAGLL